MAETICELNTEADIFFAYFTQSLVRFTTQLFFRFI